MSLVNTTLKNTLYLYRFTMQDNLSAAANAVQVGAAPIPGSASRCTLSGAAANSFILDRILSGEAADELIFMINDSANTINVFPAVGENQNGAANAGLAIAAGRSAIFVRIPNDQGGPDWRSAVIT
jgi:hypothetical protein